MDLGYVYVMHKRYSRFASQFLVVELQYALSREMCICDKCDLYCLGLTEA